MSGKDEKSKPPRKRSGLGDTLPLEGKKTHAISPEEAAKARAKLEAARAQSVRSPFGGGDRSGPPRAAELEPTEIMTPEERKRGRRDPARSKKADSPSKINRAAPPALNPELMKTPRIPLAAPRPQPARVAPASVRSPFDPPTPRPAKFGVEEMRRALERSGPGERASATPPGSIEQTEVLTPEERKRGRDPSKTRRRESPSKVKRPPPAAAKPAHKQPPASVEPTQPMAHVKRKGAGARDQKPPIIPLPPPPRPGDVLPAAGPSLLFGAKLRGARLMHADLRGADLRGADFAFADLSHADLSLALLERASLSEAKMLGTKLDGAEMHGSKGTSARKV